MSGGRKVAVSDFVPPIVRRVLRRPAAPPPPVKAYVHDALGSYSQYQEDLVLAAIFDGKRGGVYVDVGANDPVVFSNTKCFYDRGWCGVNLEPTPHLLKRLAAARPRDVNLEMGVGPAESEMIFYELSEPTLSSFDRESALRNVKQLGLTVVEERRVKVITLAQVFERYLKGREANLLSVDTEGYDLAVLQSNRWEIHRPQVVVVEMNQKEGIDTFLASVRYTLVYHNHTNGIFLSNEFLRSRYLAAR